MELLSTLAGVPVLNLLSFKPKSLRLCPKNFAGKIPSGPLSYEVSPIKILPPRYVPVAIITAFAVKIASILDLSSQFSSSFFFMSTISACLSTRFSCNSSSCFIVSAYFLLSICALRECTAGPLPLFNILICKKHSSAVLPISPPSASISLTR